MQKQGVAEAVHDGLLPQRPGLGPPAMDPPDERVILPMDLEQVEIPPPANPEPLAMLSEPVAPHEPAQELEHRPPGVGLSEPRTVAVEERVDEQRGVEDRQAIAGCG